ncbi:UNVERIFIED_CONTAM: hypothetical protein GTU68_008835, partial [Idotea baltica]|nr:hypothetical protein [Idotea baltica]
CDSFKSGADSTLSSASFSRQCPYCSYRTSRNVDLQKHVRYRHTGERPFACLLCRKRFVENIGLERHMRIHTGEKPFACPKCSKRFNCRSNLRKHILRNTCLRPL